MPKVSVVMPCYNHGKFLAEAIDAVLCQDYSDLELIIIDDHSTDQSRDIIENYKKSDRRVVSKLHEKNMGASKSRNDGIKISRGQYIGFCDADDVWMPEKLKIEMEHLSNNPSYNIVYCDSIIIDGKGEPTGELFSNIYTTKKRSGNIFGELCLGNFINTQTVIVDKQCIKNGEPFNEQIQMVEDWMFWITLARDYTFLYVDQVLSKYRTHSQSTAFVRRREIMVNRIKVYSEILNKYSDLPPPQKSMILYGIGMAYAGLGKRESARKYFLQSFITKKTNLRAFCRLLLCPKYSIIATE